MIGFGVVFLFLGWRIWKKEQITLIHSYHYKKVSEKDRKPYTEKMGKGCMIIGVGMLLAGIVDFETKTTYGWICFGLCFISAMVIMIKAQIKYNKGLF
jgi:preprotein translocase subunit Sss1